MNSSRNRKLGIVAVVVVALAAGCAALAASKLHGSGSGSGSSTSRSFGFRGPNGSGNEGRGGFGGRVGGGLNAASTYLGTSQSELRTQLSAGKTLAQIANATKGKSSSGLIDALVKAEQNELDSAVSSGRLTRSQASQLESGLKARVTGMVDGTFRPGGGGFGDHGGFGGPQGQRPQQSTPATTTPTTHI